MESEREVPLKTPLSARTYLEAYYVLTDPKSSELLPLVESFRGWDIISASVLEDAWPEEGWEEAETDVQEEGEEEPDLKLEKLEIAPRASLSTLRGQTMDTIIQHLLDSPEENSSLVAEAEDLTDFLPRLKDKLYAAAPTIKWSPHHLDLLYQALKNEFEVDLSALGTLSTKDLALVVAKLYENSKMSVLNLSHRPDISQEDLRSIIGTGTRLQSLCLLEMPQIPLESLGQYMVNCEVHHSDLLRSAMRDYSYSYFGHRNPQEMVPNVGFPVTGVVSKIVWTGLGSGHCLDRCNYLPNGRIAWEKFKFTHRNGQSLDWREALEKRLYDLCVPVAPCKLVPSVLHLLQWAGPASFYQAADLARGMACSMALSSPCTYSNGRGISFLNPRLWLEEWFEMRGSPNDFCLSSLKVTEWALFLVSKAYDAMSQSFMDRMLDRTEGDTAVPKDEDDEFRPRKAASYALITRVANSGPSQYMVADMPTFLNKVLGDTPEARDLMDEWSKGFPIIENAEIFGNDTYKILQKLSPEDVNPEGKEAQDGKQGAEHDGTGSIQVASTGTGDDGAEAD